MKPALFHAELLVAPVAHVAPSHFASRAPARGTRLRPLPARPAGGRAECGSLATRTPRVQRHACGHALHAVFLGEMLPAILDKFKVVRGVVQSVAVPMVDHFCGGESAPDHALHHEAVLQHPAARRGVGMIRTVNRPVRRVFVPFQSSGANRRPRARHLAPVGAANRGQASRADRGRSLMRPTRDRSFAFDTWKLMFGCSSHKRTLSQANAGRNACAQSEREMGRGGEGHRGHLRFKGGEEWITMSRPPVNRPAIQGALFAMGGS